MKTLQGSGIIAGVTPAQVEALEERFAVLTPMGWAIPEWLILLRDYVHGTSSEVES